MFHVVSKGPDVEPERGFGPGGAVLLALVGQSVVRGSSEVSDLDQHVLKWRTEYPLLGANVGTTPALVAPVPEGATPTD